MKYDHMKRIILALAFLAAVLGCTNSKHGTHIVDYAASIGLGSLNYDIVVID